MPTPNSTSRFTHMSSQPLEDLQKFQQSHADWIEQGTNDDEIAYSLSREHFDRCISLFRVSSATQQMETELVAICERNGAIGIATDCFIKYSLLEPQLAWPADLNRSEFRELGWDQTDIATVKSLKNPTEKINHRLRAAAGRLISMPTFVAGTKDLRIAWRSLPQGQRPHLPLARSSRFASVSEWDLQPAPAALAGFITKFDQFCDDWHLLGMTTWELPDVCGPQWVPGIASDDTLHRGKFIMTTPWHFPVLGEDGLGRILEDEHRYRAVKNGVKDAGSWETYAKLLEVHFWEHVLGQRYSQVQRVARFVTQMEFVLAEVLNLSVARIQKLRKWLAALQSGSLESLQGKR